jgi:hypothetical protein
MSNTLNIEKNKADIVGIIASSICLVHCTATPFIFIAKTCSATCCSVAPAWWQWIDYIFLVISLIAIYYSTKSSTKKWINIAFWNSWALLFFTILNESFKVVHIPELFIYFPAIIIVILHLYNHRYCKCSANKCCVS